MFWQKQWERSRQTFFKKKQGSMYQFEASEQLSAPRRMAIEEPVREIC